MRSLPPLAWNCPEGCLGSCSCGSPRYFFCCEKRRRLIPRGKAGDLRSVTSRVVYLWAQERVLSRAHLLPGRAQETKCFKMQVEHLLLLKKKKKMQGTCSFTSLSFPRWRHCRALEAELLWGLCLQCGGQPRTHTGHSAARTAGPFPRYAVTCWPIPGLPCEPGVVKRIFKVLKDAVS